ncbi:lytic transglycosylase domain-containing protein [Streptomyces laculatispora]|uniref:Lytic transglycosylase domain-containing protein n=1 Tax=Streptomyces laculatispora TaxID=887464 RepID=A0ABY9I9U9_9ACTN|nr:lytic transglycosylase domain-containing protein [Streptomyces laculatispora]WLQ43667.1 lytic transglycosylase domain-containing protein [Streptomyces laculatispora]
MAVQFGRRLRRGATTTAVAAAAVAALSASQGPGSPLVASEDDQPAAGATPSDDNAASGNSPYFTDLPPLNTPDKPGASADLPVTGSAESGIPASILAAYKKTQQTVAGTDAACRLPWQLLAAIGKVESGQARGGRVDAQGTTLSPILGPALNGQGFALIKDTDNGAYDGDSTHDRAVGPMQFIPSTWETWGQDGNGDGRKDPNNIYDAALAAGRYLCAGSRDLSLAADLDRAVLSYNHSDEYLRTVRSWFDYYKRGTHEVPDGSGVLPAGLGTGTHTPRSGRPDTTTSPSPSPSPSPHGSTPPKAPSKPSPSPTEPGGPAGKPSYPPPTPGPTPSQTLAGLKNAGTGPLTATAGDAFTERIKVRARNGFGGPLAKVSVTFAITGDTDAVFAGGKRTVVLATGADGTVTAPVLKAGEKTGEFAVRATATGTSLPAVSYPATVTARQADAIARTDTEKLTAAPGATFADIEVAATYKEAVAHGVAVTATMITDDEKPVENDKGPYFEEKDGKQVRSLTDLSTDADGKLVLSKIHAGDTAGTYKLRLTTEGGATVIIELTVESAA